MPRLFYRRINRLQLAPAVVGVLLLAFLIQRILDRIVIDASAAGLIVEKWHVYGEFDQGSTSLEDWYNSQLLELESNFCIIPSFSKCAKYFVHAFVVRHALKSDVR